MTGVANPASHPQLEGCKAQLEEDLRKRYGGLDRKQLGDLPTMRAYEAYYRKFEKTYHLLLQLESVAAKGTPLPAVAALMKAMFMAAVANQLLTVGHDLEKVVQPLRLAVAAGGEKYLGIRGREETCTGGDMMVTDGAGTLSSLLHGPDARTRIRPETTQVLFTTYAPEGVGADAVQAHLRQLQEYVRLVSPQAVTQALEVL
jgi:DNA/RNA-binding domain of Phe-tRNA-synthetase-like protein